MIENILSGKRKYLSVDERGPFLQAAAKQRIEVYTFCRVLLETGCRISEALNLRLSHVDLGEKCLYIESLKKRRDGVFRRVPVSSVTILQLLTVYEFRNGGRLQGNQPFWNWSRMTGYRHVCAVMREAGIAGLHATPKGLRHGFAVAALEAGAPLNIVQKWLGHADMTTTSIYTDLVGKEERKHAERIWAISGGAAREPGSQAA